MVTPNNGSNDSQGTTPTMAPAEAEARERATAVVLAYRAIDWEAVKSGDEPAMRALVSACELHDAARRFLEEEDCGETGAKLGSGLDRFYADSVGPRLGDPLVVLQLSQLPAAGTSPDSLNDIAPSTETDDGLAPRSRPQVTVGHTVRMNTGCGHLYVTVNESEDGKPFELFNHMGKAGGCAASQNEAIGRLISYSLRCGAKLDPLIKQLKGISCHRPAWGEGGKISSCSDAIGKALETYHHNRELRQQAGMSIDSPGAPIANGRTNGNGSTNGGSNGNGSTAAPAARRETLESGVSFDGLATTDAGTDRWVESGAELRSSSHQDKGGGSHDIHRVQGACVDCGSQLSFEEGCVKCHSCGFTECG